MNIRPLIGFSLLHRPPLFRGYATKSSSVALFPSIPSSPSSFFSSSTLNSRFPLSSFSSPVNARYYRPTPYPPRSTAPQPSINPPPSNQQKLRERPAPSTTPIPSSSAIIDPSTSTSSVIINKDEKTTTTSGASLGEEVETLGASKFLRQVYTTTGIGIGGSFAMAYALSLIAPVASMAVPLAIGGAVVSIASIISMSFSKYTVKQSPEGHYYSEQSLGRKAAYAGLSIGNALLLAPIFQIAPMISPALLPLATILSLSTMGAASLFAYSRPAASLSILRTTLVSTLAGFVAMGLISLGSTLIIGPNIFSSVWHSVDTYGGILLFSAFTAYDTYMAVERYRQRDPDHIMTATQFFLDFMNLFIRFVEIFGKDRK